MSQLLVKLSQIFLTALGGVLGASFFGAMSALFGEPRPLYLMGKIAQEIKIWAMVAAIGGTFTTIEVFELGLFQGQLRVIAKQLLFIISAFAGAHLGYLLVTSLTGNH